MKKAYLKSVKGKINEGKIEAYIDQRCKKCGLSARDVLYPENFRLSEEGLCNICMAEKYQVIYDGRSSLQKLLDEWAVGEFIKKEQKTKRKGVIKQCQKK